MIKYFIILLTLALSIYFFDNLNKRAFANEQPKEQVKEQSKKKIKLKSKNKKKSKEEEAITEEQETKSPTELNSDLAELKYDYTNEEINSFLEQYDRYQQISQKKMDLWDKEDTLNEHLTVVKNKLQEMISLNIKLKKKLEIKNEISQENIAQLVKTYESMKATEVAPLILKHDPKITILILDKMKEAASSKILTEMIKQDKSKTIALIEKFTGFNTTFTKQLVKQQINKDDLVTAPKEIKDLPGPIEPPAEPPAEALSAEEPKAENTAKPNETVDNAETTDPENTKKEDDSPTNTTESEKM